MLSEGSAGDCCRFFCNQIFCFIRKNHRQPTLFFWVLNFASVWLSGWGGEKTVVPLRKWAHCGQYPGVLHESTASAVHTTFITPGSLTCTWKLVVCLHKTPTWECLNCAWLWPNQIWTKLFRSVASTVCHWVISGADCEALWLCVTKSPSTTFLAGFPLHSLSSPTHTFLS